MGTHHAELLLRDSLHLHQARLHVLIPRQRWVELHAHLLADRGAAPRLVRQVHALPAPSRQPRSQLKEENGLRTLVSMETSLAVVTCSVTLPQ